MGIRRNAFLIAAPEVAEYVHSHIPTTVPFLWAARHAEYRPFLIDHLLSVTLRHWDPQMRQLGAQSLRAICELDLPKLGPDSAAKAVSRGAYTRYANSNGC